MMLVRLSGHSGAGKSRLVAALPRYGMTCPRVVLYTSRLPHEGEVHGRDFYFLSRGLIAGLPRQNFYVGSVMDLLQAVDLMELDITLRANPNGVVLIEIFPDLWPGLIGRLSERMRDRVLRTASVFMTAIDPDALRALPDDGARAAHIEAEVKRILAERGEDTFPGTDKLDWPSIERRAMAAVDEIMDALKPGAYDRVIYSPAEGPDGRDEWTRPGGPSARAQQAIDEFLSLASGRPEA